MLLGAIKLNVDQKRVKYYFEASQNREYQNILMEEKDKKKKQNIRLGFLKPKKGGNILNQKDFFIIWSQ